MLRPGDVWMTVRGLAITIPWVAYLFFIDVLLSSLLPVSWVLPNLVYDASSFLASTVWRWVQVIFEVVNGANITFSGAELPRNESAIVIANHVGWTDFYMIQALAVRAGMLGRCRWFAKIELRWVPFLGWGLWAMGMPMVSRQWMKDKRELDRVFGGVLVRKWPIWLISFSEATRFTPEKYEETKTWCKENDKPIPKHLLYPRVRGFVTTVQHLRKAKHVKAVYDLSIAYSHHNQFHDAPSIWESLSHPSMSGTQGYRFEVHSTRFALNDLPESDSELAHWLEQRWIAKGKWLEEKRIQWARI